MMKDVQAPDSGPTRIGAAALIRDPVKSDGCSENGGRTNDDDRTLIGDRGNKREKPTLSATQAR
jgi:hypothetical protein